MWRDASNRRLYKDAEKADEIFTILMGELPELRRRFIEENATIIKELDV